MNDQDDDQFEPWTPALAAALLGLGTVCLVIVGLAGYGLWALVADHALDTGKMVCGQ